MSQLRPLSWAFRVSVPRSSVCIMAKTLIRRIALRDNAHEAGAFSVSHRFVNAWMVNITGSQAAPQ